MELVQSVQAFKGDIIAIQEDDYGDFMRRAGSYLASLEHALGGAEPQVQQQIDEMRNYLMFHPSWGIETTRSRLLRDADELNAMVLRPEESGEVCAYVPRHTTPLHFNQ